MDADSLPAGEVRDHLLGFAYFDAVEVTTVPLVGGRGIELGESDVADDMRLFTEYKARFSSLQGIWPYSQWLEAAKRVAASTAGLSEEKALEALEVRALAAELRADITVSERDFAWSDLGRSPRSAPTSAEEALAVIGLFLRSRGTFTVRREHNATFDMSLGSFLDSISHSLLPSLAAWIRACMTRAGAEADAAVGSYCAGATRRFQHALMARDQLLICSNRGQSPASVAETLFYFDTVLVMLAGAFDAVARVAHVAYAIKGSPRNASWRSSDWRAALSNNAPGLAEIAGTDAFAAVGLLGELRNNIHGDDFAPRLSGGAQSEMLVRVPVSSADKVGAFMRRLGGEEQFGVRREPNDLWVEPDTLIESLLPKAADLLDVMMSKSALERRWGLPGLLGRTRSPDQALFDRCAKRLFGVATSE